MGIYTMGRMGWCEFGTCVIEVCMSVCMSVCSG